MANKTKIYRGVSFNDGFYGATVCPHCDNVFLLLISKVVDGESRFEREHVQQDFLRVPGKVGCICQECGEIVGYHTEYKDMGGVNTFIVGNFALLYFTSLSIWWKPWTWGTGYFIHKEDIKQIKQLTKLGGK